jgi:hypothetical protein
MIQSIHHAAISTGDLEHALRFCANKGKKEAIAD